MKRSILFTFFLVLSSSLYANSEFVFNNKNLNSVASLICIMNAQGDSLEQDAQVRTHKITLNQKRIGPKVSDLIIEVKGTCNNIVDLKTKELKKLGDEFLLTIDMRKTLSAEGKIGIKNINIYFKDKNLQSISISDPLLLTTVKKDLSNSTWAKSDQIFSFDSKPLSVAFNRRIAAIENGGVLRFKSTSFFSIWSDQAIGCSLAGKNLSESECESLHNI